MRSALAAALLLVVACGGASGYKCRFHCSGNGRCDEATGTCACADGWIGADCATPTFACASLNNCNGHGLCRAGVCVCDAGFKGAACDRIATNCPSNCLGHGRCIDGACKCDRGFTGASCETVAQSTVGCPHNCSGHGVCVNGMCECFPGFWTGPACGDELRLCKAQMHNCSGRGYCGRSVVGPSSAEAECTCAPGFCSDDCSVACPTCPNNCTGHGICVGTRCRCSAGFTGPACDAVVAIPECASNCSGHGRCVDRPGFVGCECDAGFTGGACDTVVYTPVCPNNCTGAGECFPDGCHCFDGFNGTACGEALPTCNASFHCSGNGMCVGNVCQCFEGFSGYDCATACLEGEPGLLGCHEDQRHGRCFNGTCVCLPEFNGTYCETAVEEFLEPYAEGRDPLGFAMIIAIPSGLVTVATLLLCWKLNKKRRTAKSLLVTDMDNIERTTAFAAPGITPDKPPILKPVKLPAAGSALNAPLVASPAYVVAEQGRANLTRQGLRGRSRTSSAPAQAVPVTAAVATVVGDPPIAPPAAKDLPEDRFAPVATAVEPVPVAKPAPGQDDSIDGDDELESAVTVGQSEDESTLVDSSVADE